MPAQRLDGKALAARKEEFLTARVQELISQYGKRPTLAVVLVGEDAASQVYVGRKAKACERVGIESRTYRLPATTSERELMGLLDELNRDADVNGILVQLPLPKGIDVDRVLRKIVPHKDVDAFHPENVGQALVGSERMAPCTPQGILQLMDEAGVELEGLEVVIVNHSNIVGKPLAAMLMNRDATVTVCHKYTKDLGHHTRHADVLVTGTGVPGLITKDMVKPGAIVIDVSMIRLEDGTLRGDAEPEVWDVASWVTPVPGGVGPMTISVLLQNTIRSFETKMGLYPAP